MILPRHIFEPHRGARLARGARQPAARRHRAVPPRRLPPRRRPPRRAQPRLSSGGPPALRPGRAEGRRRRRLRRPRGAPDRGVRFRVEHAGRGRRAASASRQAARAASCSRPAAARSSSSSTSPTRGARSTASAPAPRSTTPSCPAPRCAAGARPPRGPRDHPGRDLRAPGTDHAQLPRRAGALPVAEHAVGVQRRAGAASCSRRPAGAAAPTGCARKDGRRLALVFQTSINAPRQKTQAIVKQACARAGIEVELKSVVAATYFSSDEANPDTVRHFYADLQMYQLLMGRPDPQLYMERFTSWQIASKENKWTLGNTGRWRNEEYDRLWRASEREMDPVQAGGPLHPDERPRDPRGRGHPRWSGATRPPRSPPGCAGVEHLAVGRRISGTSRSGGRGLTERPGENMADRPYDVITFDCYGTLIDWERGIRDAFAAAAAQVGQPVDVAAAVRLYAEIEAEVESEAFRQLSRRPRGDRPPGGGAAGLAAVRPSARASSPRASPPGRRSPTRTPRSAGSPPPATGSASSPTWTTTSSPGAGGTSWRPSS